MPPRRPPAVAKVPRKGAQQDVTQITPPKVLPRARERLEIQIPARITASEREELKRLHKAHDAATGGATKFAAWFREFALLPFAAAQAKIYPAE